MGKQKNNTLKHLRFPYTLTNHILTTKAGMSQRNQYAIVRMIRDKQSLKTCPGSFYVWLCRFLNTVPC